jgi:hypothetical protein
MDIEQRFCRQWKRQFKRSPVRLLVLAAAVASIPSFGSCHSHVRRRRRPKKSQILPAGSANATSAFVSSLNCRLTVLDALSSHRDRLVEGGGQLACVPFWNGKELDVILSIRNAPDVWINRSIQLSGTVYVRLGQIQQLGDDSLVLTRESTITEIDFTGDSNEQLRQVRPRNKFYSGQFGRAAE